MVLKRRTKNSKIKLGLGAAVFLLILSLSSLSVQGAASIAQGFETDDPNVVTGALVSLKSGTANAVELSTADNVDRMLGVAGQNSLIELTNDTGTVLVVTTGEAVVLVSDINGSVKTGDKITASPLSGIGMRASTSTLIIGTAQANLSSVTTETRELADKDGKKKTVHIGSIPVQVDKVFYESPQDQNSFLPSALQDFANGLVGRQVSPIRVMISGLIVALMFIAVIVLLYSSIRSSIISIGRNPLSESTVHKSLLEVAITIIGILVVGMIVNYLILTF